MEPNFTFRYKNLTSYRWNKQLNFEIAQQQIGAGDISIHK
jgi:hypothetical protein